MLSPNGDLRPGGAIGLINPARLGLQHTTLTELGTCFCVLMLVQVIGVRLCVAASENKSPNSRCIMSNDSLQLFDVPRQEFISNKTRDSEDEYARGIQSYLGGNFAAAESSLTAAVANEPGNARYVRALVELYLADGYSDKANEAIQDYKKLCGTNAQVYAFEAELLFHQKRYDTALAAIRNSLSLSKHDGRMHELLGLIDILKGRNAAGVSELRRAEQLNPKHAEIWYYCGRALYSIGRYSEARDQFLVCLRIQPRYRKASENLGLCYEALGEYSKATQAFLNAIALEKSEPAPRYGEPFGFYGAMLQKMGELHKALTVLSEGVALSPTCFVANYELGSVLLSLRDFQNAEHYLLVARDLAPYYPRTYYLLGMVHKKQHRFQEAKHDFSKFAQLNRGTEGMGFPVTDRANQVLHP
jgi:tetratricopeptide (TPR) repeat protein